MSASINRRSLLQLGLGGAAGLTLTACGGTAVQAARSASASGDPSAGGSGSASATSGTIGLTYIPNIQFAPWYWALDRGLFTAQGVQATLRHHGAQEGLFTALSAGDEQFAVAGGDEMLQARAQGMDLVSIATVYQRYPVVVIVPSGSSITTLADLRGRRIGVPGKYGETWFGLLVALRSAGLTQADVDVQAIGYTQQAALATRKVDAVVGYSNNDAVQFARNGVAVRQIALGTNVPLVGISLVTTAPVLASSPGLCRGVARATVAGMRAVAANPSAAVQDAVSHVPELSASSAQANALATLRATIPLLGTTGYVDAAAWRRMGSFMSDAGLLQGRVDTAKAIDTGVLG